VRCGKYRKEIPTPFGAASSAAARPRENLYVTAISLSNADARLAESHSLPVLSKVILFSHIAAMDRLR
jgi:hypothetical protein